MVAHLLRLKLDLLRNGLRRSVAALIGMAFGVLYGGGVLVAAVVGLVALRFQPDVELARSVVVLGGTALVAGWAVVPVLLFGIDPTLDPSRFATYAVPERQLALGLALAALVGLPGVATLLLASATVVTWSRSPGGVVVAAASAVCGVFTAVLLSRTVTAAASSVLQSRRSSPLVLSRACPVRWASHPRLCGRWATSWHGRRSGGRGPSRRTPLPGTGAAQRSASCWRPGSVWACS